MGLLFANTTYLKSAVTLLTGIFYLRLFRAFYIDTLHYYSLRSYKSIICQMVCYCLGFAIFSDLKFKTTGAVEVVVLVVL